MRIVNQSAVPINSPEKYKGRQFVTPSPNAPNPAQDDPNAADAEDARKKHKLGAFSATTTIGDEVELKPSTFAINKLKEMKYIELYCFTPTGCRDHANQRLSMAEEAFSFSYGISPESAAGNTLTLKPISALSHPGKIIPDEHLTWEQVCDAKTCYLSHVIKANWTPAHVEALMTFFVNLNSHPYSNSPEGKQALVWYQAHARKEWHQKLGTRDSFNLAFLNKALLADFKKKASELALQNNVALVSSLSPSKPLSPLTQPPSPHIAPATLSSSCSIHAGNTPILPWHPCTTHITHLPPNHPITMHHA